jgi:hypothetical protein
MEVKRLKNISLYQILVQFCTLVTAVFSSEFDAEINKVRGSAVFRNFNCMHLKIPCNWLRSTKGNISLPLTSQEQWNASVCA